MVNKHHLKAWYYGAKSYFGIRNDLGLCIYNAVLGIYPYIAYSALKFALEIYKILSKISPLNQLGQLNWAVSIREGIFPV